MAIISRNINDEYYEMDMVEQGYNTDTFDIRFTSQGAGYYRKGRFLVSTKFTKTWTSFDILGDYEDPPSFNIEKFKEFLDDAVERYQYYIETNPREINDLSVKCKNATFVGEKVLSTEDTMRTKFIRDSHNNIVLNMMITEQEDVFSYKSMAIYMSLETLKEFREDCLIYIEKLKQLDSYKVNLEKRNGFKEYSISERVAAAERKERRKLINEALGLPEDSQLINYSFFQKRKLKKLGLYN